MKSKVYFLDIKNANSLPSAVEKSGLLSAISKDQFVAIKIHFGEKGNIGYVKPEQVKPFVKILKELGAFPFFTDANTIYKGQRADAVHHLMVAAEHGFHPKYLGAPVVIADGLRGKSFTEVEVNLKHFKNVKVSEAIYDSDFIFAVSHFKGHELCGFGGAIKNLGMGCSAKQGKYEQHNSAIPSIEIEKCTGCGACVRWCEATALTLENKKVVLNEKKCVGCGQCILACSFGVFGIPWDGASNLVQEKMVEYAFGALKNKKGFYINFLNHITPHCDCFKTNKKPIMEDVGILFSLDPVAIDQACLDMISKRMGDKYLIEQTGADGNIQLEYAEKLGIGSRKYELEIVGNS